MLNLYIACQYDSSHDNIWKSKNGVFQKNKGTLVYPPHDKNDFTLILSHRLITSTCWNFRTWWAW